MTKRNPLGELSDIELTFRRAFREVLNHNGQWTMEDAEEYLGRVAAQLGERVEAVSNEVSEILRTNDRQRRAAFREAAKRAEDAEAWAARTVAQFFAAQDRLPVEGDFVYILWGDDPEQPLYVGETRGLLGRLGSHHWSKRALVRSVQLITCRNEAERKDTERRLIRHYRPPLNILLQPFEIVTGIGTDAETEVQSGTSGPLREPDS